MLFFHSEYSGLTPDNYVEMLSTLIQIEDFTARLAINNSAKHNRKLIRREPGEFAVKVNFQRKMILLLIVICVLIYPTANFV